jgi:Acyl-CoA reductase (LuxC)
VNNETTQTAEAIPFVVRGRSFDGRELTPFATGSKGQLQLDELVWPSDRPVPLFSVPAVEIVDLLVEVGDWIRRDPDGVIAQALESLITISGASRPVEERAYADLPSYFSRDMMNFQLEQELGGAQVLEEWRPVLPPGAREPSYVRAFPARAIHILAGNAPGVAAISIVRSALAKGAALLKLASNDLFTAPAILRGISAVAPGHPLEESFSAVYWRGGDATVESVLMRPQFFEKLVVWGGHQAVKGVTQYVGPGMELISFDPKTSISVIGREAFTPGADLLSIAAAAATDATVHNQDACTASRFQFVQGTQEEVDRFCELLVGELGVERHKAAACSEPVPSDLRDDIAGLRSLAPYYRVWGSTDGSGMVVRSDEPVSFYPTGRVVNVVAIAELKDVFEHINASTQTVGVYPEHLRAQLRDELCSVGVQRVTGLGHAGDTRVGLPHDGFYPLARMVRWGKDES